MAVEYEWWLTAVSLILLCLCLIIGILAFLQLRRNRRLAMINQHQLRILISNVQQEKLKRMELQDKKDLIESTVDGGANAVETIHKSIATATFDIIERLSTTDKVKSGSQQIREIHDQTASGVYQSIKVVNKQIGSLADNFIKTRRGKKPSQE